MQLKSIASCGLFSSSFMLCILGSPVFNPTHNLMDNSAKNGDSLPFLFYWMNCNDNSYNIIQMYGIETEDSMLPHSFF